MSAKIWDVFRELHNYVLQLSQYLLLIGYVFYVMLRIPLLVAIHQVICHQVQRAKATLLIRIKKCNFQIKTERELFLIS